MPYTEELKAKVLEAYKSGEDAVETLAEDFGVNRSTIVKWARKEGIVRGRNHQPANRKRTKPTLDSSPDVLADGAWVYGSDGIGRWVSGQGM